MHIMQFLASQYSQCVCVCLCISLCSFVYESQRIVLEYPLQLIYNLPVQVQTKNGSQKIIQTGKFIIMNNFHVIGEFRIKVTSLVITWG